MGTATTDTVIDERMLSQVDRILHSDTLRTSEVLRRLLKFLAEKSVSGEAEHLKEYTVAIDALDKPSTYDPRHDSAVRIQVGRLRQKLAEYYRTEGKDDATIVDLPKGRFKLTCETRVPILEKPQPPLSSAKARAEWILIWLGAFMWLTLVIVVAWGEYSTMRLRKAEIRTVAAGVWTQNLEQLWRPFIGTSRPLIVAIEDPLWVEFERSSGIYYRDKSINDWAEAMKSPGIIALRKFLKEADVEPSRYYTAYGEVNASFLIGKLLAEREPNISLVRTSELSWQQIADSNVVFVGVQVFFNSQLQSMPIHPQLVPVSGGIQNLKPLGEEPKMFSDQYSMAPAEEGEVYALVTHLPGPLGNSDIESFTSNRSAGYVGAVQWFTDPRFANVLVGKLKKPSGDLPRYYQVLLKVRFKDDVPTETSYVLSRELN
jgi:hypothetical protein